MADVTSYLEPVALAGTLAFIEVFKSSTGVPTNPDSTATYAIYSLVGDSAGAAMSNGTGSVAALPVAETGRKLITHSIVAADGYESGGNYMLIIAYVMATVSKTSQYVFSVS